MGKVRELFRFICKKLWNCLMLKVLRCSLSDLKSSDLSFTSTLNASFGTALGPPRLGIGTKPPSGRTAMGSKRPIVTKINSNWSSIPTRMFLFLPRSTADSLTLGLKFIWLPACPPTDARPPVPLSLKIIIKKWSNSSLKNIWKAVCTCLPPTASGCSGRRRWREGRPW